MIEARHTRTGKWLADFCSGPLMDRHFRRVRFIGKADGAPGPLLMVANHFSWWDGFIQHRLNREIFSRKLHTMMLEEQLRRHPVLNRCGCYSVKKHSRSLVDTLDYTARLLRLPENMVLIFPQGRIGSIYTDKIHFEAGLGRLLRQPNPTFRLVFNVNLTDYGTARKPELKAYFRLSSPERYDSVWQVEEDYNRFYRACIQKQGRAVW
ncbi:MAG: lysophospholipid acyltransferase family protein [Rikenellaceae bacterium]|nr:lysophospholipid acyltransferase family protein [Rikenellaceae bacterium]